MVILIRGRRQMEAKVEVAEDFRLSRRRWPQTFAVCVRRPIDHRNHRGLRAKAPYPFRFGTEIVASVFLVVGAAGDRRMIQENDRRPPVVSGWAGSHVFRS